jgi:co-chaperonin GroES (HSP10)
MDVIPIKDRVLVAENASEVKSESGIILDNAKSVRESKTGTVLAIGPDVVDVKVGDKIYLEWNKAHVVKIGDAQRVIIKQEDIVAVVE